MEHPIELTAESLWDDVAARLRGALNEKTFRNWFSEVGRGRRSTTTRSSSRVPNDFTREWIEGHFAELIRAAIKDATGAERRLQLDRRPGRRLRSAVAARRSGPGRPRAGASAARRAGRASTRSTPSTRS